MHFHSTLLAAAAVSLITASAVPAVSDDAPNADTVLATIDGTDITLGHMIALRANLPPHYDQLDDKVLFDGILNQLIQHTLLAQSLENGPSRQALLTIENETRAIKAAEATDGVMSGTIPEEDVRAAYEEDYVKTGPETEYNAAHILVETEEEARDLVQKLADGADFGNLAQEFSTGPSGPSGGKLGWFGKGVMVEPFFDAVTQLEPGAVSDPVETQFGWHVIKLLETRSQDIPEFEEVREQLESHLREEAFEDFMASLESAAVISRPEQSGVTPDMLNNTDLLEN